MILSTKQRAPLASKWHVRPAAAVKNILAGSLFSLLSLAAHSQGVGGTAGGASGFEVDADFKSGQIPSFWATYTPNKTTYGFDWSKGATTNPVLKQLGGVSVPGEAPGNRAVWQVDGNWGNASSSPEQWSFSGSSNKNLDLIGAAQSPYSVMQGGSGPQKNDLTNTYLHSREINGKTWLFFGAETRATSGNSYLDFEYNQAGVGINTATNKLVGNGPVGGRTPGDFLLIINYTNGGATPYVEMRVWQANATWSNPLALTAGMQFMATNTAAVDPVAPNKAFTGSGGPANTVMALQFVEGGINVTDQHIPGLSLCTAGATVNVKTRSSSSWTSELKDLDILKFSIVPAPTLSALSNQSSCEGAGTSATFTTDFAGTEEPGSTLSVNWYRVANSVETQIVNNVPSGKYTIVTANGTSTLTVNNLVTGDAGTYRAKLAGAACGAPTRDATLSVTPVNTVDGPGSSTLCLGDAMTSIVHNTTGATGIGSPSGLPGGVSASFGSNKVTISGTPTASGTYNYSIPLTGGCGSINATGTITVGPSAATPSSVVVLPKCDDETMTVEVVSPVAGVTYTISQPSIGATYTPVTYVSGTLRFTGLTFGKGYSLVASSSSGCTSAPETCGPQTPPQNRMNTGTALTQSSTPVLTKTVRLEAAGATSVQAAPNPFRDRVRFQLVSSVSGQGTLEIYDARGVRVQTVYSGRVEKGKTQTVEFSAGGRHLGSLLYIFRVGDQQVSGKLIGLD